MILDCIQYIIHHIGCQNIFNQNAGFSGPIRQFQSLLSPSKYFIPQLGFGYTFNLRFTWRWTLTAKVKQTLVIKFCTLFAVYGKSFIIEKTGDWEEKMIGYLKFSLFPIITFPAKPKFRHLMKYLYLPLINKRMDRCLAVPWFFRCETSKWQNQRGRPVLFVPARNNDVQSCWTPSAGALKLVSLESRTTFH